MSLLLLLQTVFEILQERYPDLTGLIRSDVLAAFAQVDAALAWNPAYEDGPGTANGLRARLPPYLPAVRRS